MTYKTLIVKKKSQVGKWQWHVWANGKRIIAHSKKKLASNHVKELKGRG